MNDIEIIALTDKNDPRFEEVIVLFRQMYKFMDQHGLLMPLADDGENKWIRAVKNTLDKFCTLIIVVHDDKVVGFAHGALRFSPDYLGTLKTGIVTHIFIAPEFRSQDLGSQMLKRLQDWFQQKEAHSIELQVVADNKEAMRFWEKAGYKLELKQYRKFL